MSIRSTAFLGIRLLAIYWGIRSLEAWGQLLSLLVPGLPWEEGVIVTAVFYATLIPGLTQSVIALALWLWAGRIASALVGGSNAHEAEAPSEIRSGDWRGAAISVAGVAIAATALPGIAGAVYQLTQPAAQGFDLNVYQLYLSRSALVENVAQTLIGLALAFGRRPIAYALAKLRGPRG